MYDRRKIKEPITLDWILSRVTEYEIYSHYIGEFKVGMIYKSPFRKDRNPSFGIFYSKSHNKLLFKDHGTGECGDIVKFVSLLKGITDYNEILKDMVTQLNITKSTKLDSSKQYIPSGETVIGIVRQSFTEADKSYWSQFNIDTDTLKKFNVFSIKYYLCNGIVKGIYRDDCPMFAYKVNDRFKIYRPLADKHIKWRNNLREIDIQGYKQLPRKGDILIITKSLKDVMCLYKMGIPAIAASSESTFIPEEALQDVLKRFKRVLVCYDRDEAGIKNLRKISLKTGLETFLIHKKFKAKDISDAIKLNGFETIKEWLENELRRTRKEV